jgi:hypothetical protein
MDEDGQTDLDVGNHAFLFGTSFGCFSLPAKAFP